MALIHWKQIDGDLTNSRILTGSLRVSGSLDVQGSTKMTFDGVDDYFNIVVNGEEKIRVNEEGTFQLQAQERAPTAVSGGMFYSASNDFFLGFKD